MATTVLSNKVYLRFNESNYICFRTVEKRDEFRKLLQEVKAKGYYLMAGGSDFCRENLHMNMIKIGYVPLTRFEFDDQELFCSYLGSNDRHDREYYRNLPSVVSNTIERTQFHHLALRRMLHRLYPTRHTEEITPRSKFPGGVYLVRALAYIPHFNAKIIRSQEDLDKFRNIPGLIMSEYINPLLIDGRKTMFKVYFMLRTWAPPVLYEEFGFITAKAKYEDNVFDSHNMGLRYYHQNGWWPEKDSDPRIPEGIRSVFQLAFDKLKDLTLEPELHFQYGYRIIAMDIIFDTQYHPWLVDFANDPMLASDSFQNLPKAELMINWEFENGILPIAKKETRNQ